MAVLRDGRPVMLHTHKTNDAAERLIRAGRIPELRGASIVRREVKQGRSRFDFLLEREGRQIWLEVKSCTLFSERLAMFPDAVTERGRRHLEELAHLSEGGSQCAVLFVVHSPQAEYFLPEYHTDPALARTLLAVKDRVAVIAVAVGWDDELNLLPGCRSLPIPWAIVEREATDKGYYLLIRRLEKEGVLRTERGETLRLPQGYYLSLGYAEEGLGRAVERVRRPGNRTNDPNDPLKAQAPFHALLPILTADEIGAGLASSLAGVSDGRLDGLGAPLFQFREDPLASPAFHHLLQHVRMERLLEGRP